MTTIGVLEDMVMRIWRNDKRVVKDSGYTFCSNCCLEYISQDHSQYGCLARYFRIQNDFETCINGYKYETNV